MTETMLDILRSRVNLISKECVSFIEEFSGMHHINTLVDYVLVISPHGNQHWNELPPQGKQIQAKSLPEVDRLSELFIALTKNLPDST